MKARRQTKIIELIQREQIETQEELAQKLQNAGINVTQATISRDIRELRLTKVANPAGRQYYAVIRSNDDQRTEKFIRVLREGFRSIDKAQNILVIKTVEGMAMAVAAALDNLHWEELVGCIAGDDTIFCAVRTVEETGLIMEKLSQMLDNGSVSSAD